MIQTLVQPCFIVITGPTGVGKTSLVDDLSRKLGFPIEVINADVGQMYTPLTIGTAKPDLEEQPVAHHLFNIFDEPQDYTVTQYRQDVVTCLQQITQRGAVQLIVGGSSFYITSLFFPPVVSTGSAHEIDTQYEDSSTEELWNILYSIDPERAQQIHIHDRYRIKRALQVWHEAGVLPSTMKPHFNPPGSCALFYLTRDTEELAARIELRIDQMMSEGWFDEVKGLSSEWHTFLVNKKIIGYTEIRAYLSQQERGELSDDAYEMLIESIAQRTRSYAKRQRTFWRRLKKQLQENDPDGTYIKLISEVNLTLLPYDLYLEQVTQQLQDLCVVRNV